MFFSLSVAPYLAVVLVLAQRKGGWASYRASAQPWGDFQKNVRNGPIG
jgi:hypothetical protein